MSLIRGYPIGRRNFLLITFNWLANSMVYNGLSYYSANLNVSSHLGFFIRQVSTTLIMIQNTTPQTNSITNQKYKSTNTIINLRVKRLKLFTYLGWPYDGLIKVILQFCCGDPLIFHRLVHYGQMGQEMDSLRNDDDWRPLLHLLHVCSPW